MNPVDIAIVILLAVGVVTGLRRGFVMEVAAIVGIGIGLAVARQDYAVVRRFLLQVAGPLPASSNPQILTVVSYLIVFLIVWGAIILIAGRIRALLHLFMLGWLDRLAGAIVGLLQSAIVVQVLLRLAKRLPNHTLQQSIHHSHLAPSFVHLVPYLDRFLPHVIY